MPRNEGSGRKPGTPNKATAELKALAGQYGPAAIAMLANMSGLAGSSPAESEVVRLGSIRELLDRGYGKAAQAVTGADGRALRHIIEVVTGVPRADKDEPDDDD